MLRGEATLVFRDATTGEITREVTESNYVTEDMLNRMISFGRTQGRSPYSTGEGGGNSGRGRFGRWIVLGELNQVHDRGWNQIWPPFRFGVTESGVTSPRYLNGNVGTGGTFAYYDEWQQRFAPPSTEKTIYTIAINRNDYYATNIPNYQNPIYVSAYIVLTTPCVQAVTETLDVFYRIIYDNPEQDTSTTAPSSNMMYRLQRAHRYQGDNYFYPDKNRFYYHSRKHLDNSRNQYMNDGGRGRGSWSNSNQSVHYGGLREYSYPDYTHRCMVLRARGELELSLGCVIGSIGHTDDIGGFNERHSALFYNPVVPETTSPIQNIFSHSAAATGPFYSATSIPAGTGTLNVNGDGWTDPDWQKLLRIEITGAGGVGTGTYKVMQRNITGFLNNTYSESAVSVPFINAYSNYYGVMFDHGDNDTGNGRIWQHNHMTRSAGANMMAYDGTSKVVAWTSRMVFKYDMLTNERKAFRNDTTPPLDMTAGAQDISQVMVADNGDIWVADALNGLMRISADETTVDVFNNSHTDLTGIANSECFGVTKTPGRIWAIMHDSLIYTTDNGATFTIYNSTSTPSFAPAPVGQERRCWFLQGDPSHPDHRLAIGYNTHSTYNDIGRYTYLAIRWWDSVSGQGSQTNYIHYGYSNNSGSYYPENAAPQRRQETFQMFHCSPNDGIWGCRRTGTTSGSNDNSPGFFNYGSTTPYQEFTHGDGDNERTVIFWWAEDSSGNDAMLCSQEVSSRLRYALCQQDGQRLLTDAFDETSNTDNLTDPRIGEGEYGYRIPRESGYVKAYFKDAGLVLTTAGRHRSGAKWYALMSVGNDANVGDSGTFRHLVWKEYGWDGAAWVEGHAGSKTIHSAEESIIDGLAVSFDDDSGNQTFVDTDYYTCGVIDGILMDGGTEFDSRYQFYYKPVQFNLTEIEGGGLLPATQTIATRGLNETEISTMVDPFNTSYDGSANRFAPASNNGQPWGFRMYGSMPDYAYFQCRVIDMTSQGRRHVFGFADASKIGTPTTETNIDYGVRVTARNNYNYAVEVISNGAVVHVEDDPGTGSLSYQQEPFNVANDGYCYYRFTRNTDTNNLEIRARNKIIWTFTGVSQALIPSFWADATSGVGYHYWNSMSTNYTDYHVELGDSGSNIGKFHPNYWMVDGSLLGIPSLDEIKINGVPVTLRLVNDYGRTPLNSGEVELLTYQGKIRFSPADVGKTLTIDRYNVILHQN